MGPDAIHTGHRLSGFEQDAAGVTARFVDRSGGQVAEGPRRARSSGPTASHSAVRSALFPREGPPRSKRV